MPVPRVRRVALLLAVAGVLGTAGCDRTVAGSAEPGPGVRPGGDPVAAAATTRDTGCPSVATLRAALPGGDGGTYTLSGPVLCSGEWAVATPIYTATDPQGDGQAVSVTQLFHRVGDGWQAVDRTPLCAEGSVPSAIYQLTCESN